jgi:hypothetical protein
MPEPSGVKRCFLGYFHHRQDGLAAAKLEQRRRFPVKRT